MVTLSDPLLSVGVRRPSSVVRRVCVNFYKLNLNSKTTEGISMKLGGSVQYPTLTKCCYFSRSFEIQYGRQAAVLKNLLQT